MKISLSGKLLYYILPYRKKTITQNINLVFKDDISKTEKIKLTQAFYTHFITTLKEMVLLALGSKKNTTEPNFIGLEHITEAFANQKGVIILFGHIGNFQLACGLSGKYLGHIANFHAILRPIKNKLFKNLFFKGCDEFKVNRLSSKQVIKKLPSILKQNQGVFFAFDQHAKLETGDGIAVDFFGKLAGTFKSLALLAKRYQTSVVPAYTYRDKQGKHHIIYLSPLKWIHHEDKNHEIYLNSLQYNQVLENMIMRHPEQWLWSHNRWKI